MATSDKSQDSRLNDQQEPQETDAGDTEAEAGETARQQDQQNQHSPQTAGSGDENLKVEDVRADEDDESEAQVVQEKIQQLEDAILRAKAETENVRKRAFDERVKAQKFAAEGFAASLLPVMDALTAALETTDAPAQKILEGVTMTQRVMLDAFEKNSLRAIIAMGKKFDPNLHQAIGMEESDEEPGTVVKELQIGYQLHERVIRPSMVIVGKARQDSGEKEGNNTDTKEPGPK